MPDTDDSPLVETVSEPRRVYEWRLEQARVAGLDALEAQMWAASESDVGELRRLARRLADKGCPVALRARILR